MNAAAAAKPSSYALKLMAKMGWKEGQGLGKNETGISKHIVISKREDNVGLGVDNSKSASAVQDQWWHNSFSRTLASINITVSDSEGEDDGEKKSKKSKKDKKKDKKEKKKRSRDTSEENENSDNEDSNTKKKKRKDKVSANFTAVPSETICYEELFKATGGARLGMRARREQKGKIMRTEGL